ncbi:MAG: ribosome silencing factor [Candidatus Azobacteroides sp.]|nr:ribosome silencing factor [Candidatus Azobacteroides sp.]
MQTKENTELLLQKIIEGIQEKKGKNIVVADLTAIPGCICSYFVICEGNSPNQVSAITDSIKEYVKENAYVKPIAIDGEKNAQWIAMDYGDIIVHIFLPEIRAHYQLESLWNDAKLTQIPNLD